MGLEFWKMRVWQLNFEVHRPIPGLPLPTLVVEEVQQHRSYRMDGKFRRDPGSQLVITLAGAGGVSIDGEPHRLTRGMAFLHNHGDRDFGYFFPPEGTEPWRFLWIAMLQADELIEKFTARYGHLFELPFDTGLIPMLSAYQPRTAKVEILSPFQGAQLIYKILAVLGEYAEKHQPDHRRNKLVIRTQELILQNLHANRSISDIAAELGVSREHLSRLFHAQTGQTVHEYEINCKLEIAMNLLYQHRLSCKEIAEQAGFSQYSAFARAVRKRTGKSPEALRERTLP